jgi:hypothetical protein
MGQRKKFNVNLRRKFKVLKTKGNAHEFLERRGDIIACKRLSYMYPTLIIRNAANLTQFLPKASKTSNRNKTLIKV